MPTDDYEFASVVSMYVRWDGEIRCWPDSVRRTIGSACEATVRAAEKAAKSLQGATDASE